MNYLLVFIQFGGILIFLLTGNSVPSTALVLILELVALTLTVWAVVVMKLHTLTVMPSVKQGGQLCTSGPYRVIRHPMYMAVLILLLGLLLNDYSLVRLVVFFIVLVDLILKMKVEEKILIAHYADYKNYMTVTKRIIPFIY